MAPWHRFLIDAYRLVTVPYRNMQLRTWTRNHQVPVSILFYHRVADTEQGDWTISNAEFQRQIEWLQENFEIISLGEVQRRIRDGQNDKPAVSISFDDGYADNCQTALPLLIKNGIPFTYFVCTANILDQTPFPHDVARGRPLAPNSPESIRALANAGVDIGCHTRTHVDLGSIENRETIVNEVAGAICELKKIIARPVRYFAFPYGRHCNLNPFVFELARECGIEAVCSAYGGFNWPGDDAFHLQRIHGDPNFARLKNWLTFDPRMLRTIRYTCPQITRNASRHGADSAAHTTKKIVIPPATYPTPHAPVNSDIAR